MNSIGNLMLHLAGNLGQWIVAGIGGKPDVRNRPAEFAARGPMAKTQLLQLLEQAVEESRAALTKASAAELLRVRRIQGSEISGMEAIFNSIPHFRGHTQEIIHLTRALLGDRYRVAWAPLTPEQGAPSSLTA
jgi:hypothetical protein